MRDNVVEIRKEAKQSSNGPWNDLKLNSAWSVGMVSALIEQDTFESYKEWENHYYKSGEERMKIILGLSNDKKKALLDPHSLSEGNADSILSWSEKSLNFNYGRTRDELNKKAHMLYGYMCSLDTPISLEEAAKLVRHRVLRETWDGIVKRERNTIKNIRHEVPSLTFEKATGVVDTALAVDYEVFQNGELVAGMQIKPISYMDDSKKYIRDTMKLNAVKHKKYKAKYGVDTLYVFSKRNGEVINKDVISLLNELSSHEKGLISQESKLA